VHLELLGGLEQALVLMDDGIIHEQHHLLGSQSGVGPHCP
jgi:hypothetical protein